MTTTLYHVTYTKKLPSIRRKGLRPLQTSNWVHAETKARYGRGEIFAFENRRDADRWASKMDWAVNMATGTGLISVVAFNTDIRRWKEDDADPLNRATYEGRWLKYFGGIAPEDIIDSEPFTVEKARSLVLAAQA